MIEKIKNLSLINKILIGMILGGILGILFPKFTLISIMGNLFVGALKAIAPLLVFFLVISAIANRKESGNTNMRNIILLYLLATFAASATGVIASFIFPVHIEQLNNIDTSSITPPGNIYEVIQQLLLKIVDNPIAALASANYIGILSWAVIFGIALKGANSHIKDLLETLAEATSLALKWIIHLAPLGIMGLVFKSVSESGLNIFTDYLQLLAVLIGSMAFVALILNPIIVFLMIKENPYPLVFKCLKESGLTAFFARSSAANIPINMKICEDLGLDRSVYAVSIPLGATINMAGAAILSILSALSACGASGVTGGSLLLIPVAASLFGISNDIAMQIVSIGFIIGIIQDSCETALNSSSDVLFTIAAEYHNKKKYKN